MIGLFGLDLPWAIVVVGLCSGIAYGLLGVGLVLVHRSSGFINFAHSQIGAFGAAVMAILELATSHGLAVAAEGVESAEQEAFLLKLDCYRMQGRRFGPAMPPDELKTVLQAS